MFIIITLKSKSKNTLKSFFKHFNSINEQLNVNKQLTFYNKKKQQYVGATWIIFLQGKILLTIWL